MVSPVTVVLVVPALEVDAARMRRNLDLTRGLVLAEAVSIELAQRIGMDVAINRPGKVR